MIRADWDLSKFYIPEGLKSFNRSVFSPAAISTVISSPKDLIITILENGEKSDTFAMDEKNEFVLVRKMLDREQKVKFELCF